jgi:hypothetical protein
VKRQRKPDPQAVLRDGAALDRAMDAAARRIVERHRQLGAPLVIWRRGKVVLIPPGKVKLPPLASKARGGAGPALPERDRDD